VCDAEAERRGLCRQTIAYDSIKQRRSHRAVVNLDGDAVAAGGVLPEYVPFYFCNRSPMLGAIHQGLVPAYQGGQRDVVYLVSSFERVVAHPEITWCFTDGHAVEAVTNFYDAPEDVCQVDRDAVETWRWGGRWLLNDPDVKRRKQAEFLVYERFAWELVERIGVLDAEVGSAVRSALAGVAHKPPVTIQPKWYYNL
jgi:hypothetical protein